MSAEKATPLDVARVTLMLTGDVMTGRGIDQIQPIPSDPVLYEDYMHDARGYLRLAETASGPIPRRVAPTLYVQPDWFASFSNQSPGKPSRPGGR